MAFDLFLAAERHPGEILLPERPAAALRPRRPVAVIEVDGDISEGAFALARSISGLLQKPGDTVIIRFGENESEEPLNLNHLARWIQQHRADGHDLRVVISEAHTRMNCTA